ncbi:CSC1-like protein 2 isoform X1 [Acanthaster planci]|uniref:CSC1-like protein 2 isoform X1 n=1 Tax=Acanthaster planci TaxID=133434 RepID=A0A8B7ZFY2_ACAPL|nr:CSC1-like protein 2 isoform X1 [Acanthaster planci]XP_022103769.1 CSC1-like protein 2 isoform X1 [Acanthaster planci]XP_022103770.1 CSC1-like protein 2 isoform X1 [Acanthaster planci]XP_022103771.1 CSC1-like protein 2 isoform X1 [Acanthaster planci]
MENCVLAGKNNSAIAFLEYGGIPSNIGYNILFFVILVLLFSVFRKIAGDYGRIALMQNGEERFLRGDSRRPLNNGQEGSTNGYNVWTSMFYGDHSKDSKPSINADGETTSGQVEEPHNKAPGFLDWLPAMFKIKDEDIRLKSGVDAVQYLQFQRYLIILIIILCVLSIGVILPVNFSGSQELGPENFGRTTISNIPTNSDKLWVHTIFCMLFFLITVGAMRHFSTHLPYREETDNISSTLFVTGIPLERTDASLIKQHFQEAYPDVTVLDVQFAYDIAKLKKLDLQRRDARLNRLHCEGIYSKTGERPKLRQGTCGQIGCCDCCGGPKVDAIDYYSNREEDLTRQVMEEKGHALKSNLGMAFVTVQNELMAGRIVNDYATLKTGPPTVSSVSKQLHSTVWSVHFAPKPDDIVWENLSVGPLLWWGSVIFVNIALFILLFFLTTPSVIMTSPVGSKNIEEAVKDVKSPFISQFLPTILLWTFAALLPILVIYSSYYCEFHWTRTKLNHTIMRKTFIFLILMVLVLPSLGLASAQALFEYWIQASTKDVSIRWGCIFLPENGAFFVNYVITSAFIGTALELIRFPELFLYGITMLWTRSKAEKITKRSRLAYEFQYGVQYAWVLTTFSIILVYSITCPLVTPVGLLYILFKHMVDRYNIYFAYKSSRIDKDIHNTAINFVVVAGMLLQLSVLFFSVLRLGSVDPRSILLSVFLVLCIGLYIAKVCFNIWMGYIPPAYDEFTNVEDQAPPAEDDVKHFIPDVLQEGDDTVEHKEGGAALGSHAPKQAYGTMDGQVGDRIRYGHRDTPDTSDEE